VFAGICLVSLLVAWKAIPYFFTNETLHMLFWVLALVAIGAGTLVLRFKDPLLIHRVIIMIMPLLLLLMLFLTLSDTVTLGVVAKTIMHLLVLFIVSMVCHGELAVGRPEPKHLTEVFLWMSIGGVLGGLFNGLVAPVAFNAIVEYQLMIVVACLLLPPLSDGREGRWARWVDVALGGVILAIGAVLLLVRYYDDRPL